jgi:ABC-2 type transport system ATP-binding protein
MSSGLRATGLHKRFGDVVALRGVDLSVQRGQLVGFLGPNGSGKTTTMRGILGLVSMDAGSVTWDGHVMSEDDRRQVGYMPQERGLYPRMKVHEHIALCRPESLSWLVRRHFGIR